ncbi:MAG: hypothetical protein EPN82_09825 [Bacteroidetes bacterium]|nr:MAG: hypothetical protein EPN82_09825 [Bacteroidota bacterium]
MKEVFSESDITGVDIAMLFKKAIAKKNPLEFIYKNLDRKSEHYVKSMYDLYNLAIANITYVAELYINRDNQNANPYSIVDFTEEELRNRYNKSQIIYMYIDTFISDILIDNFYNKPGLLDEKSQFITKINIPEKTKFYDFCYIEDNIIHWFGQVQQLGITMYYLNKDIRFNEISIEFMIDQLIPLNLIRIKKGQWSSVRTKAMEVQIYKNDKSNKLEHPFKKNFDVQLAVQLILDILDKGNITFKI